MGEESMMQHYYETIPGWHDFQDIYADMVRRAPSDRVSTFVEVGSCFGRSLASMGVEIVNSGKPIALHSVDHGEVFRLDSQYAQEPQHVVARKWEGMTFSEIIAQSMKPCVDAGLNYTHHKRKSNDTSGFGPVDFVFLDACHDADGIFGELTAWWPMVKPGGFLGGHDHTRSWPGVEQGVSRFFGRGRVKIIKSSFLIGKP